MEIFAVALLVIYFLPTLIACCNTHRYKMGVFLMDLLLGWTGLGWIIALIWAVCP